MFAIIRLLHLKRLAWFALALAGCAGHMEPQRPAEAPRRITLRRTNQRPVELSEGAFRAGMAAITADLPATSRSDTAPLRIHPAAASEADLARTRRYLEWCRQAEGEGDCAGVLDGGIFREDARDDFALHVAISGAIREAGRTLKSITPEQVRAALSLAMLVSAGLMIAPDPASKLLAVVLACNLIAYLGVDLFNHVVLGYLDMRKAALGTSRFDDLVDIGRRYASVLSPTIARVAVMLATLGVAKIASLLPMSPTGLPGAAEAAANAEAAGLPPLGQVGAVEGVAVAGDGSVTVTVGGAVAMTGAPSPTERSTHPPVPAKATEVLAYIRQHGSPPPGMKGGSIFENDGRNGGQFLPKTDSRGSPIQYREWDINAVPKGFRRGPERLLTGSDGRAYYTADHYATFVEMP